MYLTSSSGAALQKESDPSAHLALSLPGQDEEVDEPGQLRNQYTGVIEPGEEHFDIAQCIHQLCGGEGAEQRPEQGLGEAIHAV